MLFHMLLKKYSNKEEPTATNYGEAPGDVYLEIWGLSILPLEK